MGMRVFLTGASGYLGSVLTTHLANLPEVDGITGTYNSTTPKPPLSPKVSFVKLDMRSPDLARAMAGHDIVIHTAFIVLWWARMPAATRDDISINGTRNVANAAIGNRVQRFLYASSVAAYDPSLVTGKEGIDEECPVGKGVSPLYYFNNKAIADTMLIELLGSSGITLTRLRPTYIIGPHDRSTVKGLRESPVLIPGKDPRIQFVHEDDVASAFVQALTRDMPGAYNVVPDDFLRLREVYRLIGVRSAPTVPAWLARLVVQIRWRYFGSATHPMWLEALYGDTTFSNKKLRATGWVPRYDTAGALRSALEGPGAGKTGD
jgi:UDP-glucose 4-epimerase